MSEIFDWKCCYFNQKGGKWLYGHLKLYPRHVRFKPDAGKLAMKSLTINLRNLTAVKRRTTNLFYNALVISERGLHQHWFSSFTDVYDVLNVLEHFWKGILLSPLDGTQWFVCYLCIFTHFLNGFIFANLMPNVHLLL